MWPEYSDICPPTSTRVVTLRYTQQLNEPALKCGVCGKESFWEFASRCVCVCVCVCVCIYIYIYVCMCVCVCVYMCVFVCVCMCMYVCLCMCVCVCIVCMCVCVCVCMCVCIVCVCVCMCMCVCLYVCVWVCACMYVCMYVYVCVCVYVCVVSLRDYFVSYTWAIARAFYIREAERLNCQQQRYANTEARPAPNVSKLCATRDVTVCWQCCSTVQSAAVLERYEHKQVRNLFQPTDWQWPHITVISTANQPLHQPNFVYWAVLCYVMLCCVVLCWMHDLFVLYV